MKASRVYLKPHPGIMDHFAYRNRVLYCEDVSLPTLAEKYGTLVGCRLDPELLRRLLRFGSPSGVQLVCEVGAFTLFLLIIGRLGALDLAATSLAFNVNTLAFMPVYGIGIATTTLVGQRIGQGRPRLAARGVWTAFSLAAGYTILVSALYALAPELLLVAHGAQLEPDQP